MRIHYRRQSVGEVEVFYREAGPADAPVILLLHGFPTASHMFRDLIPALAGDYHVYAPDLPGFGLTVAPPRGRFDYTFDNLAQVVDEFIHVVGLRRYALYVFDYGAPVGFRLAVAHPERITAIVSQNGNAYEEGLGDTWDTRRAYWREPTEANREACRESLRPEMVIGNQYLRGNDPDLVSPDGYTLDVAYLARPGVAEIQLDLMLDYRTNLARYPEFQAHLRAHRPPLLAVWGRNDASFIPRGAEAFRRDLPDAELHFVDAGHFALETRVDEIASYMLDFLGRHLPRPAP
jgi:pimeloyl-ACP methyl ester carboxylesterase